MKRAIEETFPIVEINKLAVPERNAFKPIYQMHKWFARRASCVFRAILLASLKPAGTNIMEEFYKDHTKDPDTQNIRVLDPFMGGGTTVVEALRLGCNVTGIDLSPVAWFIVKVEVEPVDPKKLQNAVKRLENRKTASGKSVKEELLSHYKTICPCCGEKSEAADIIYSFWVKSAICTNPTCKREVPLFNNYIIVQKKPSVRYFKDYPCAKCKNTYDLEIVRASLTADQRLTINSAKDSAGEGRANSRWALLDQDKHQTTCPWCLKEEKATTHSLKVLRKKVPLTVLLCPNCYLVWQYRGTLPDEVSCPACEKVYAPENGNIPSDGAFICSSCGTKDKIINSIRKLPDDRLLPTKPYAIEGYCSKCGGEHEEKDLLGVANKTKYMSHACNIYNNKGKFFKRINPLDLKLYQDASKRWEKEKDNLPYPKSRIPLGEKTKSGLIAHHFVYWYQMFNPRQLLCLSTLLKAIDEEEDQVLKEMLLSGFFNLLNNMSDFTSYIWQRDCTRQVFARHDFAPKNTPLESTVWGVIYGMGSFNSYMDAVIDGKTFFNKAWDYSINKGGNKKLENDNLKGNSNLYCISSSNISEPKKLSLVITDPPYGGNVNYSELADYFYVWLRLVLSKSYPHFAPEVTPKVEEIIKNPTRGKTEKDYEQGLTVVWQKCYQNLEDNGLMVFTFHHTEQTTWESLLESLCNAGFVIEAIYPIHGEAENSLHLNEKEAISYDLIHICKKRDGTNGIKKRSWAGIRQEIRQKAKEEIQMINAGRYGSGKLSGADVNLVLIGKCLELYSKHYGAIIDHDEKVVPLQAALSSIRMMVEQLVTTQQPLPSELEHIDPVSYIYFTSLCDRKEIQSDEVHKATRGILEVDKLMKGGVLRKGRARRGRTYEVKPPNERYNDLQELFKKKTKVFAQGTLFPEMEEAKFDNVNLIDLVHFLMGLADASENLVPWINHFKPVIPQIRVALEYLKRRNPTFQEPISKILNLLEG